MTDDNTRKTVNELREIVLGHGGTNGLRGDVRRIKGHLYANPNTGGKGMVSDMREIKDMVAGIRGALKILNWLIGSGVLVAGLAVARWYLGG